MYKYIYIYIKEARTYIKKSIKHDGLEVRQEHIRLNN